MSAETTSQEAIAQHRQSGSWKQLQAIAQTLILDAKHHGGSFFTPKLGGGTRLMLALNHRISDDIDLFVDSPAWLSYLTPRTNDAFEDKLSSYVEDADHVKWRFPMGEIDFIVRTSLLNANNLWNPAAPETTFELEPPLEVLAKKLFYRGWALTPRDLFDWYAIEMFAPISDPARNELACLLVDKIDDINIALERMPEKKIVTQAWSKIKAPEIPDLSDVLSWAQGCLANYEAIALDGPDNRDCPRPGRS